VRIKDRPGFIRKIVLVSASENPCSVTDSESKNIRGAILSSKKRTTDYTKEWTPPMRANHIALLKTLSLFCVILLHAMLPFTTPGGFWTFYADRQSSLAEVCVFWMGFIVIPAFMLASGYLAALSEERRPRSVAEQIVNRAKRLLVPWFLLMVFWMAPLYTLFDIPAYNRPAGFPWPQHIVSV
jgi:hypothetical protein